MFKFLHKTFLTVLFAAFASQASAMFIQADWLDPTAPGVGTNRYSYCYNDPINCIDPGGNQALYDLDLTQDEADQLNEFAAYAASAQAAALEAEAATNPEMADLILNQAGKYRASSEVFQSRVGVSWGWRAAGDAIQAMEVATGLTGLWGNGGKNAVKAAAAGTAIRAFEKGLVKQGAVAAVRTSDGRTFIGLSQRAADALGQTRVIRDDIAEMARDAKAVAGCGNGAACAEVEAISRALEAGADLKGAKISASWITGQTRDLPPGTMISPCGSCAHWTDSLGLEWVQ